MAGARREIILVAAGILAWLGIFVASWQGALGVSGTISDSLLVFLAVVIAYRLWRLWSPKGA